MRVRDINAVSSYQHIVLSPHLDDAVLSLGGTIARLTRSGERVLVVTVCAGFPPPSVALGHLAREILGSDPPKRWIEARREEDRRALERLGADWYWEQALDAIFRHPEAYGEAPEQLFGDPKRGDTLFARATAVIFLLAHHAPGALFYAPLAIGGHVDHQVVSAAAMRAIEPHRMGFYEDFPYALLKGALRARLDHLRTKRSKPLARQAIDIDGELDAKIEAIAEYSSQIAPLFESNAVMAESVAKHAGKKRTERLWLPA